MAAAGMARPEKHVILTQTLHKEKVVVEPVVVTKVVYHQEQQKPNAVVVKKIVTKKVIETVGKPNDNNHLAVAVKRVVKIVEAARPVVVTQTEVAHAKVLKKVIAQV